MCYVTIFLFSFLWPPSSLCETKNGKDGRSVVKRVLQLHYVRTFKVTYYVKLSGLFFLVENSVVQIQGNWRFPGNQVARL